MNFQNLIQEILRPLALALAVFYPLTIYADIDTDKKVGHCVGYMATLQKLSGMRDALSMADNQKRAMKFANDWMNQAEQYKTNSVAMKGFALSAHGECRDIGIRPSSY